MVITLLHLTGVPALLTGANRSAGNEATRWKRPQLAKPPGSGLPFACQECGEVLDDRSGKCCDTRLTERIKTAVATFASAGPAALSKCRAEGTDPAHSEEARRRQGLRAAENVRMNREWEESDGSVDLNLDFKRDIWQGLRELPHSQIMRATGLSLRYCSLIRRGAKVPHPRHWRRFAELIESVSTAGTNERELT